VFDIFSRNYTVAHLEAAALWTRTDAKIALRRLRVRP
jgi:hypothetical protein